MPLSKVRCLCKLSKSLAYPQATLREVIGAYSMLLDDLKSILEKIKKDVDKMRKTIPTSQYFGIMSDVKGLHSKRLDEIQQLVYTAIADSFNLSVDSFIECVEKAVAALKDLNVR